MYMDMWDGWKKSFFIYLKMPSRYIHIYVLRFTSCPMRANRTGWY